MVLPSPAPRCVSPTPVLDLCASALRSLPATGALLASRAVRLAVERSCDDAACPSCAAMLATARATRGMPSSLSLTPAERARATVVLLAACDLVLAGCPATAPAARLVRVAQARLGGTVAELRARLLGALPAGAATQCAGVAP